MMVCVCVYVVQIRQKNRSIESIRAKRKRYRNKKKLQGKDHWKEKLIDDLSSRWKQRHEQYVQAELDEQAELKKKIEKRKRQALIQHEIEAIETRQLQDIVLQQEEMYHTTANQSLIHDSDALLLPSVEVPEECTTSSPVDIATKMGIS